MELKTETHESFGMLQISRISGGGGASLFGSSMLHSQMIEFRILEGSVDRKINNDWYHGGKNILTFRMSHNQFSEAITSLNHGEGTPITITYRDGKCLEPCPSFINKKDQFKSEIRDDLAELQNKVTELTSEAATLLGSKKPLTAKEKKQLMDSLLSIQREINSNIPYVQDQFDEQMDKSIAEAKSEIEGFVSTTIHNVGLSALKNDIQLITNGLNNK